MMPAPLFGRVAAFLAPLVTFLVTFLVAQSMLTQALGPGVVPAQVVRRELRVGAPGVPAALDPGAALGGISPPLARPVLGPLVAWREGRAAEQPARATRVQLSRRVRAYALTARD